MKPSHSKMTLKQEAHKLKVSIIRLFNSSTKHVLLDYLTQVRNMFHGETISYNNLCYSDYAFMYCYMG